MISDTASSPISPCFSADSTPDSEATSDEQPDLGAFGPVLRAWSHFQPHPRIPVGFSSSSEQFDTSSMSSFTHPGLSSATVSATEDADEVEPTTVWDQQHRIWQSYLNHSAISSRAENRASPSAESDGSQRTVEIASDIDIHDAASLQDSLDLTVPVFSPNTEPSALDDNTSQPTLRRTDFPIQELSTVGSRRPNSHWSQSSDSQSGHTYSPFPEYPLHYAHRGPGDTEVALLSMLQEASSSHTRSLVNDAASTLPDDPHHYDRSSQLTPDSHPPPSPSPSSTSSQVPSLQTQANFETPLTGDIMLSHDSPPVFSTQIEPPSPMPTPMEGVETFPYEETDYDVRTPTKSNGVYPSQSHGLPRPHTLIGLHALPPTIPGQHEIVEDLTSHHYARPPPSHIHDGNDNDSAQFHPGSEASYNHTASDHEQYSNSVPSEDGDNDGEKQPTLGLLDEALNFIAAERARFEAGKSQREATGLHQANGDTFSTSPNDSTNLNEGWGRTIVAEPKQRKRRRKKSIAPGVTGGNESKESDGISSTISSSAQAPPSAKPKTTTRPLLLATTSTPPTEFQIPTSMTTTHTTKAKPTTKLENGENGMGGGEGKTESKTPADQTPKKKKAVLAKMTTPAKPVITILTKPKAVATSAVTDISVTSSNTNTGLNTNILKHGDKINGGDGDVGEVPINLTGKKGRRVGRREREKEKAKRDAEIAAAAAAGNDAGTGGDASTIEEGDDDNDNGGNDAEEEEGGEESSGLFDFSSSSAGGLARRRSTKDKGDLPIALVLASGTGEPGTRTPRVLPASHQGLDSADKDDSDHPGAPEPTTGGGPKSATNKVGKKKTRSKRTKSLVHAKSYPNLPVQSDLQDGSLADARRFSPKTGKKAYEYEDYDDIAVLGQNKRTRLVYLANKLLSIFPEQKKDLKKVINRLEVGDKLPNEPNAVGAGTAATAGGSSAKKAKGHIRGGSKGGSFGSASMASFSNPDIALDDDPQDPAELDILGLTPTPGASLIHVFIDHSNILIGLLNFLKRHPPPQCVVDEYLSSRSRPHLPTTKLTPLPALSTESTNGSKPIAIPRKGPTKSSTIPIIESPITPLNGNDYPGTTRRANPTIGYNETTPIPLPSFATAKTHHPQDSQSQKAALILSKSLPNHSSVLDGHMPSRFIARNAKKHLEGVMSDGDDDDDGEDDGGGHKRVLSERKEKKFPRHLWHAALALVLERGRPVSRRVVVTSSPLYQPMEKIQQLGYEVRIYIRVPDLGDGMDRREKESKHSAHHGQGKSNTGGGKGGGPTTSSTGTVAAASSSPVKAKAITVNTASATSNAPSSAPSFPPSSGAKSHARHLSGSTTSTESGSNANKGIANSPPGPSIQVSQAKIRYREQGVDELLQLKLHQALADIDKVPRGSTIVLATGDGNVGQFNQDGFLGPVRTALKRGWRVELVAWEDGLSKAWRREFGENSEWGQKGLFRVVPLEQFATSLVEAAGW